MRRALAADAIAYHLHGAPRAWPCGEPLPATKRSRTQPVDIPRLSTTTFNGRALAGPLRRLARLSFGAYLGLALLVVLAVLAAGMHFVQQSTSETARLAGSLEARYEPALRASRDVAESL